MSPRVANQNDQLIKILKNENLDTAKFSLLENSHLVEGVDKSTKWNTSQTSNDLTNRMQRSPRSAYKRATPLYHAIPTKNIKYEKFIDTLLHSNMAREDIAEEIILYNQALETGYNEKAQCM